MDFCPSRWFQHKGNRHRYKVSFRIHLSLRWGFDPAERAVYRHSGSSLGLCFLRDAIPFSLSERVWETHRKITEYRGCASVFVTKSMRWMHRLTVYATAEGSQRRHLPISKIVQTIVKYTRKILEKQAIQISKQHHLAFPITPFKSQDAQTRDTHQTQALSETAPIAVSLSLRY